MGSDCSLAVDAECHPGFGIPRVTVQDGLHLSVGLVRDRIRANTRQVFAVLGQRLGGRADIRVVHRDVMGGMFIGEDRDGLYPGPDRFGKLLEDLRVRGIGNGIQHR